MPGTLMTLCSVHNTTRFSLGNDGGNAIARSVLCQPVIRAHRPNKPSWKQLAPSQRADLSLMLFGRPDACIHSTQLAIFLILFSYFSIYTLFLPCFPCAHFLFSFLVRAAHPVGRGQINTPATDETPAAVNAPNRPHRWRRSSSTAMALPVHNGPGKGEQWQALSSSLCAQPYATDERDPCACHHCGDLLCSVHPCCMGHICCLAIDR